MTPIHLLVPISLRIRLVAQAFDKAIALGIIAVSEQILDEYTEVLHRKKLDKYLTANQRLNAIQRVKNNSVLLTQEFL